VVSSRPALLAALFGIAGLLTAQAPSGVIEGQVTDGSGAAVPGAMITITGTNGTPRSSATNAQGRYRIDGVVPGNYNVRIVSPGFAQFVTPAVSMANQVQVVNARLQIQAERANVTVSDSVSQVGVDPSQNVGQIVLRGDDLDAFADDPEDLTNELQMLAGPSTGPTAGQIFIDGFTGGIMPPKASIREIRVNQNPFSAEYDRVGFGRVEVFTKPGSDNYHGQASFDFGNRALTARNPYLTGPIVPNYRQEMFAGNFGGPVKKKASFFIDVDRRVTDENSLLNYTSLDSSLNPAPVSGAVVAPSRRFSSNPRFDYAITPNHTLTLRYSVVEINAKNQGIGSQTFDEASRAYAQESTQQSFQVVESSVLGAAAVNDFRFQFLHNRISQTGVSSATEIDVVGAFTAGGTFASNYIVNDRSEFQDNLTIVHGDNTVKAGVRLRTDGLDQKSTTNFNGRFIFGASPAGGSGLAIYRQNQVLSAQGLPQSQIAALGFGPSEFLLTAGNPLANVQIFDAGLYLQDDWRIKPNLALSAGLRYEIQTGISDHIDFAPRVGLAWAPGKSKAKTVIRAGAGIFYDRFPSNLLINAALLNGVTQTQYIVRNPPFFPEVPDPASLAALKATYRVDSRLQSPAMIQVAAGFDRQLPHGLSVAVNYASTRGVHQLLTRDINAPFPTAFNNLGQAIGARPFGAAAGDIYQYEGSGIFRQSQAIASFNARINSKISFFGYYLYSRAMSDTDGAGTMPSNPYNVRNDYGRAAFDFRHRVFVSAAATLPLRIRMSPFIYLQSGLPYNLISGLDTNNDGNPGDDRPAFAQDLARASVIQRMGFGAFDTAPGTLTNAVIVPRNYLEGPGILSLTVRVSRSWSFGEVGRGGGNTGADEIRGGEAIRNGGLSGSSSQSGLSSVFGGIATAKRFNLTATASFRNALNNVNPAMPIGNLNSPFFGKSVGLNTFGPLPGAGPNAGAGNRHIELQLRLTF
jgi:hypothetical protein